eukprot:g986.t1
MPKPTGPFQRSDRSLPSRRLKASNSKVKVCCAAPGLAATNLQVTTSQDDGFHAQWIMRFGQSGEDGTMPLLRCCAAPGVESGDFYEPEGLGNIKGLPAKFTPEPICTNPHSSRILWEARVFGWGAGWRSCGSCGGGFGKHVSLAFGCFSFCGSPGISLGSLSRSLPASGIRTASRCVWLRRCGVAANFLPSGALNMKHSEHHDRVSSSRQDLAPPMWILSLLFVYAPVNAALKLYAPAVTVCHNMQIFENLFAVSVLAAGLSVLQRVGLVQHCFGRFGPLVGHMGSTAAAITLTALGLWWQPEILHEGFRAGHRFVGMTTAHLLPGALLCALVPNCFRAGRSVAATLVALSLFVDWLKVSDIFLQFHSLRLPPTEVVDEQKPVTVAEMVFSPYKAGSFILSNCLHAVGIALLLNSMEKEREAAESTSWWVLLASRLSLGINLSNIFVIHYIRGRLLLMPIEFHHIHVMGYTLWIWLSAVLVSIVVYCMVTPYSCLGDAALKRLAVTRKEHLKKSCEQSRKPHLFAKGFYPNSGTAEEVGEDEGRGYNINIALPVGYTDECLMRVFDDVLLPAARRFRPDLILVSAGFDAMVDDPLGEAQCTAAGFGQLTRRLWNLAAELAKGRLIFALEGGYHVGCLAQGTAAVLKSLLERTDEKEGPKLAKAPEDSIQAIGPQGPLPESIQAIWATRRAHQDLSMQLGNGAVMPFRKRSREQSEQSEQSEQTPKLLEADGTLAHSLERRAFNTSKWCLESPRAGLPHKSQGQKPLGNVDGA